MEQNLLFETSPFDRLYGLELVECSPSVVRATVAVTPKLKQPLGLVHGGVYAAIAEAVSSMGTNRGVANAGMVALGMSNQTHFLRPVSRGTIHATAQRRRHGQTVWIWDVDMTDDEQKLCAVSRMVIATRPAP